MTQFGFVTTDRNYEYLFRLSSACSEHSPMFRYYFRTKKCFRIINVFVLRIATTNFKLLAAYDDNHVKIMIS